MENTKTFLANIDKGFHQEAVKYTNPDGYHVSSMRYFAERAKEAGIGIDDEAELKEYTNRWRKHFLNCWKAHGVSSMPHMAWEEEVRQYAEDRWALEKAFELNGVRWNDPYPSTVEKGFTTSTTQVLFPFFFDTAIVAGKLATPVLERLVSQVIPVQSHTADHLELTGTAADESPGELSEGARVQKMIVKYEDRRVNLRKLGYGLLVTYEALRLQRLPMLEAILRRFGQRFAIKVTDLAVETIISGDGDSSGAATVAFSGTVYDSLIALEMAFAQGYNPTMILAPKETITDILTAVQYQDPLAGILHQTTGGMPNPLGMDLVRWDAGGSAGNWLTTSIMMIDPSLALVEYTEGGMTTESEKIIDGQWELTVVTMWVGFGIMDRGAVRVGTGW